MTKTSEALPEQVRKRLQEKVGLECLSHCEQYNPDCMQCSNMMDVAVFAREIAVAEREAEIHRLNQALNHMKMCHELEIAEAVRAERERIRKEADFELSIWARQALSRILNQPSGGGTGG